ncbi:hypothetical protein Patl1_00457 [Pistacia atlantica]|uniref:Uncharacterized protein n=1 Tax=Pistacia atlantica TaxID=434234 RepID=A0ACC1CCC5_9ROSI|nr:hypothetical protein Patl1_00457 [Pistacia atlantica]
MSGSSSQAIQDETVYVAVGKDVNKCKSTLLWALQNFHGHKFCILHVHQLVRVITLIRGKSRLEEHEDQELERETVKKFLDDYINICHQAEVYAEKLYVEMDDIGEGIIELVHQHSIKKPVMGAAADKHYAEGMTSIKSRKAVYVHEHLPLSCQYWFICGGHLIQSGRGGVVDIFGKEYATSISETGLSNPRSRSSSSDFTGSCSGQEGGLSFDPLAIMDINLWDLSRSDMFNEASGVREETSDSELLEELGESQLEVGKLKREVHEESGRRVKAEKATIEANRKARALEISYNKELRRRKEIEEVLANEKQEFQNMKKQWNEERLIAVDQRVPLENQVATFNYMIKELEEEKLSAVEMSQVYKRERDELLVERNDAVKVAEELLEQQAEAFSVFSLAEIHEASCNFDPSLKIGEQGYWNIYKGLLHSTTVAIKVLNTDSSQAHSEFQREVEVMSKIRHPNLITLIGACPEACALIYEYLPNGNLQDRLSCKENSPPLSWQTRIRIATDICSVLIFLHSTKPRSLVYGDLKAENIRLDDNLVCKLSDFRIPHRPRVLEMEEVSPKSDIYLFGVILLQLLTGKSPLNIANEVQDVVVEGNLVAFLDFSAGDWPFLQATQLAHLALRCCDIDPNKRPDLAAEEVMQDPHVAADGFTYEKEALMGWLESGHDTSPMTNLRLAHLNLVPNHALRSEVMQDPHVAADGFTYEKEALMGWLESGHDTSPMTNLRLAHLNLVPNHALRSVIREWLQHR